MCNLSWTPHSSLENDNPLNHSRVSPNMGCITKIAKNGNGIETSVMTPTMAYIMGM